MHVWNMELFMWGNQLQASISFQTVAFCFAALWEILIKMLPVPQVHAPLVHSPLVHAPLAHALLAHHILRKDTGSLSTQGPLSSGPSRRRVH